MTKENNNILRGGSSGTSGHTRRRLEMEEDIIQLPPCDMISAAEKFKNTVIGRMFHKEGRSMDAIIGMLPKPKIWDVEGRAWGTNLGNGKFQFDFDKTEDMMKVLNKRPWHFNRWSFSLEKWEPFTSEIFPNTMIFWVKATGVPVHYWNDDTFTEIGRALGDVKAIDAKRDKFQVSINADNPLQFERRVGFPNGDTGLVSLEYEGLHRHCFTCKLLPHEETTCPHLTEDQKEYNKKQRFQQSLMHGNMEQGYSHSQVQRKPYRETDNRDTYLNKDRIKSSVTSKNQYTYDRPLNKTRDNYQRWEEDATGKRDLRHELKDRRESRGKEVWKRIERPSHNSHHADRGRVDRDHVDHNRVHRTRVQYTRDRYQPYHQRDEKYGKSMHTRSDSHGLWRPRYNPASIDTHLTETPSSRVSSWNRRVQETPSDSQRTGTVSETRTIPEPNTNRPRGHLVIHQQDKEEERLRKRKGKAHVADDTFQKGNEALEVLMGRRNGPLRINANFAQGLATDLNLSPNNRKKTLEQTLPLSKSPIENESSRDEREEDICMC